MLGSIGGELGTGFGQGLGHDAEDVQAGHTGLFHGAGHDFGGQAVDLDVHLDGADTFGRTGDLEVHIAEGVFVTEDVGQHGVGVAVLDEAHSHTSHGSGDRHTGVHEGQAAAADSGHGGRAVGFQRIGHHADGVGEGFGGGQNGLEGAFGKMAVADFAAGHAHGLHFAHGVGREVIVQHEALAFIALQGIDLLLVAGGAEGGHGEGLGFAAGEEHGAVGAGQDGGLDLDGAHGLGVAGVDAQAFVHHALAHELLFEVFEDLADAGLGGGVFTVALVSGHEGFHLVLHGLAGVLAFHLVDGAQGVFHAGLDGEVFHIGEEFGIVLLGGEFGLGLADQLHELFLSVDEGLDGLVGPVQAVDEVLFLHELGFAFHHDHGVTGSGEGDVHVGAGLFFGGGVQHELTVHTAEAGTGNRAGEGNGGNAGGGRSGGDAQHVRIVHAVSGNDGGEHLNFVAVTLGEERTDGAVDEAGDERFVVAGAADLTTEEVAGDAAGGVHALGVFHGEGEEVLGRVEHGFTHGDKSHRAAALNPDGAVGLTCQTAGLQNDFLAADNGGNTSAVEKTHVFLQWKETPRETMTFVAGLCPVPRQGNDSPAPSFLRPVPIRRRLRTGRRMKVRQILPAWRRNLFRTHILSGAQLEQQDMAALRNIGGWGKLSLPEKKL